MVEKKVIDYVTNAQTLRLEPVNKYLQGCNWLVLARMPGTPRGVYDEEFDVNAKTKTIAKRVVDAEIAANYQEGLRAVRFVWRGRA